MHSLKNSNSIIGKKTLFAQRKIHNKKTPDS